LVGVLVEISVGGGGNQFNRVLSLGVRVGVKGMQRSLWVIFMMDINFVGDLEYMEGKPAMCEERKEAGTGTEPPWEHYCWS